MVAIASKPVVPVVVAAAAVGLPVAPALQDIMVEPARVLAALLAAAVVVWPALDKMEPLPAVGMAVMELPIRFMMASLDIIPAVVAAVLSIQAAVVQAKVGAVTD